MPSTFSEFKHKTRKQNLLISVRKINLIQTESKIIFLTPFEMFFLGLSTKQEFQKTRFK